MDRKLLDAYVTAYETGEGLKSMVEAVEDIALSPGPAGTTFFAAILTAILRGRESELIAQGGWSSKFSEEGNP